MMWVQLLKVSEITRIRRSCMRLTGNLELYTCGKHMLSLLFQRGTEAEQTSPQIGAERILREHIIHLGEWFQR